MKIEIDIKDFINIDAVSVADAFIKNHSIEAFDEYMFALQRLMSDLYHRNDAIKNAISVMNDNKIAAFLDKYSGVIIGVLIGIIILMFNTLYELFKFIFVVGFCGYLGNYVHKNKAKVKMALKNLIDKM